jgi:hypothetical protein
MNTIKSSTVLKVKDSFAVEASGPRHFLVKMGGMFMYYRNLLEV